MLENISGVPLGNAKRDVEAKCRIGNVNCNIFALPLLDRSAIELEPHPLVCSMYPPLSCDLLRPFNFPTTNKTVYLVADFSWFSYYEDGNEMDIYCYIYVICVCK